MHPCAHAYIIIHPRKACIQTCTDIRAHVRPCIHPHINADRPTHVQQQSGDRRSRISIRVSDESIWCAIVEKVVRSMVDEGVSFWWYFFDANILF